MTVRHPIIRLQELLESWEDYFFLRTMLSDGHTQGRFSESNECSGPLKYHDGFRKYLLSARTEHEFDTERFYDVKPSQLTLSTLGYQGTGRALFNWTARSRHVYYLDAQMALLLANTSLNGIRWSDIKLPFDAFAIVLEGPIDLGLVVQPDCFIVSREHCADKEVIRVLSAGQNNRAYTPISGAIKTKLRKMLRRKQWKELQTEAGKQFDSTQKASPKVISHNAPTNDTKIVDTEKGLAGESINVNRLLDDGLLDDFEKLMPIYRLVAGLCLYIASLPSKSTHVSGFKGPVIRTLDPRAITKGAEVTSVTNCYTLSPVEQEALQELQAQRGEVCAHWRRGYWRRETGQGHIPDAPRTVWVRPALVRGDRLPDDGLPGGTKSIVKKPKE